MEHYRSASTARLKGISCNDRPFTRVYNDVLETLVGAQLNGTQYAIVLAVQRLTAGWQDKHDGDYISIGQLSAITGRHRTTVQHGLAKLRAMNILVQVEGSTRTKATKWRVNDYATDFL